MRARKYYGPQAHRAQLARDLAQEGFDVLVTSYSYFEGDSAAQVADRNFLWLGLGSGLGLGLGATLTLTLTRWRTATSSG